MMASRGEIIGLEHLPPEISGLEPGAVFASAAPAAPEPSSWAAPGEIPLDKDAFEAAKREAVHEVERRFMERALTETKGNLSKVSRQTGLNRAVLYDIMKRLELDPETFRD